MIIHAKVEVAHENHRGLECFGQVKAVCCHFKTFLWVAGKQQHMSGVAVGGIGTGQGV